MQKLRLLAAFIVICSLSSLTTTIAEASASAPEIIFAQTAQEAQEAQEAEPVTEWRTVKYMGGTSGGDETAPLPDEGATVVYTIFQTAAAPVPVSLPEERGSNIRTSLFENTTLVCVEDFVLAHCPDAKFTYGDNRLTVSATGYYMEFVADRIYFYVNGRVLPLSKTGFFSGGSFYLPIRAIAPVFSYDVGWDQPSRTVILTDNGKRFLSGDEFYNYDEYILLAKLIRAESGNQPLKGQVAVGNVVLNRVRDKQFPNTIRGVIYDRSAGIQFTTAYNGTIDKKPTEQCLIASKLCLEGYSVTEKALYFFNPRNPARWVKNNRYYLMSIADHDFYY